MTPTQCIFFVSEEEYPRLQQLCPSDFPFTYEQFVKRVDDGMRQMPGGIPSEKVYVTVSEFADWCIDSKVKPDTIARCKFAVLLKARSVNPNAHL